MKPENQLPGGKHEEVPGEEHENHEEYVQEDKDYGKGDESTAEEARKGELSGPANDLISQPDEDNDHDDL